MDANGDYATEAIGSFAQIERVDGIAETTRIESFTNQVMSEVNRDDKACDMDFCIDHWQKGIQGAIALRSREAFTEAQVTYAAMRGAWPGEKRVKQLGEQIQHW